MPRFLALACSLLALAQPAILPQAQAQARNDPPLPAAQGEQAEYRLGAGDLLRISVYQNPDLTLETRITDSGSITYPLVGALRLGGLPVAAAEATIAQALRNGGFVRSPQVTLAVLQVRGHQASVVGQVNRPGRYALESTQTRLSDLLALAGGAAAGSADSVVLTGTRDGAPMRVEVDLPSLFGPDSALHDRPVRHGDVVWVPRQPQVYIYGEVQRPGVLRLERDMTVLQALASGGGLTPRGTERGIRVHRRAADGRTASVSVQMGDTLRDGDVVHVQQSLF